MTQKELSRLRYLNREIQQDKERLAELEAFAMGITATITGLPHAGGIADKTAVAAEIADLKSSIETTSLETIREYNRIHNWAAGLEDGLMRQVIALKYVSGLTWYQVAQHIAANPETGEPYTADALRVKTKRFLKKSF